MGAHGAWATRCVQADSLVCDAKCGSLGVPRGEMATQQSISRVSRQSKTSMTVKTG